MSTKIITTKEYLSSLLYSDYEGLTIYWKDKNGHILMCNKHQALLYGFDDINGMIGLNTEAIGSKLNFDREMIDQINKNDLAVLHSGKDLWFEEEVNINNERKIFRSKKTPFYDRQGDIIGTLGISIDIAKEKTIERNLKITQHATDYYLECILMSCPSNIYWIDRNSRIIGCNDQQARSFGATSRFDMIGKNIFDVIIMGGVTPEMAEGIRQNDIEIMNQGTSVTFEETAFVGGECKTFLSYKTALYDEHEKVIGLLGISTDITDRKLIEENLRVAKQQAETLSLAKTRFIANISHDIRTPLVGIYGIAEWLTERVNPEFQAEVKAIQDASTELLNLLNEVLTFAKLESGNQEVEEIEFDLETMIHHLFKMFKLSVQQKNLQLILEYPANMPRYFLGKRLFLHRILLNLLSNAVKFTDRGQIVVKVCCQSNPCPVDTVIPIHIQVMDTGIGIPQDKIGIIFEEFARLSPSYKGHYKGTGLGLAIVKQFLQQLDGDIKVESKLGAGSTFSLSFPLISRNQISITPIENFDQREAAAQVSSAESSMFSMLKIAQELKEGEAMANVLLIEDHPMIQKHTVSLLNKYHCYAEVVSTGEQGLLKIQTKPYDLILMDIGLPDMSGFTILEKMGQVSHSNPNTPVVALTAHYDIENRDAFSNPYIKEVITKPLTPEILQGLIRKYFKKEFEKLETS